MKSVLLERQQTEERIAILTEFIQSNPEPRELKRALAVKMALQDEPYANITELLSMHKSCISSWKQKFVTQGLGAIKLAYKGAKSYLTPAQRTEVIGWLKTVNYWNLEELVTHLDEHYEVIYQSKQSYYELFSSADISWKKSQKVNPKLDPELVKKKSRDWRVFGSKPD